MHYTRYYARWGLGYLRFPHVVVESSQSSKTGNKAVHGVQRGAISITYLDDFRESIPPIYRLLVVVVQRFASGSLYAANALLAGLPERPFLPEYTGTNV